MERVRRLDELIELGTEKMDHSHQVRFRIGDCPYGGVHQGSFSVRTLPPVVVETLPEAGQANVDPDVAEIRVKFSKRMKDQC